MKKINLLSVIAIITSILFSSCNSSLTITKRHSKRGYYVATNRTKTSNLSHHEIEKIHGKEVAVTSEPEIENLVAIPESEEGVSIAVNPSGNELNEAVFSNTEDNDNVSDAKPAYVPEKKTTKDLFKNTLKNTKPTLKSIKAMKQTVTKSKSTAGPQTASDALSLFWIVIMVLLILWLLGILTGGFGIGGLIHLLLLIALILLILWLLRII